LAIPTLHAAVGMAIVKIIPNPVLALIASFFSHMVMDRYPDWSPSVSGLKSRWDFKNYTWKEWTFLITQILLSLWICYFLIKQQDWILFLGAFLATAMDLWDFIYAKIKKDKFWINHGGWFPFRKNFSWQGHGMTALQNATLDVSFIFIILNLIERIGNA